MKKFSLLIFLFIAITNCNGKDKNPAISSNKNQKTQQSTLKRYDVQSGIVKYKTVISGKVMGGVVSGNGSQSLYFRNWGAQELKEEESNQTTDITIFGKKNIQKTHNHVIDKLDNGESYHVDMDKKQTYLRRDPMMDLMKKTNTDAGYTGKKMLESMGGKIIGNEQFMGYNCEVWSIMGGKQWLYKGVLLKLHMTLMGVTTVTEATSAQFNGNVADRYFKLPDYPIIKEEGFENNEAFDTDMQEMDANMDKLSKMSYEEWKKAALADGEDEELKNMSEEELRQAYNMIQKMIKMRKGK